MTFDTHSDSTSIFVNLTHPLFSNKTFLKQVRLWYLYIDGNSETGTHVRNEMGNFQAFLDRQYLEIWYLFLQKVCFSSLQVRYVF